MSDESVMIATFDSHPDYLRAIGLITTEWARLEAGVALALAVLLGGNIGHGEAIVYSLGSFKAKCDVVRSVARTFPEDHELRGRVLPFLERAHQLSLRRNDMTHAMWGVSSADHEPRRCLIRPATKNPDRVTPHPLSELEGLAAEIGAVADALQGLAFSPARPRS